MEFIYWGRKCFFFNVKDVKEFRCEWRSGWRVGGIKRIDGKYMGKVGR